MWAEHVCSVNCQQVFFPQRFSFSLLDLSSAHELLHSMYFLDHPLDSLTIKISLRLPPLCVYYFLFTPFWKERVIFTISVALLPPPQKAAAFIWHVASLTSLEKDTNVVSSGGRKQWNNNFAAVSRWLLDLCKKESNKGFTMRECDFF